MGRYRYNAHHAASAGDGWQAGIGRALSTIVGTLLVALPGTELTVEVEGEDAAAALEPLVAALADPGDGYG